jgi:hypothetical protein
MAESTNRDDVADIKDVLYAARFAMRAIARIHNRTDVSEVRSILVDAQEAISVMHSTFTSMLQAIDKSGI